MNGFTWPLVAALAWTAPQHPEPATYAVVVEAAQRPAHVAFTGSALTAEPVSADAARAFRGLLASQLRRYPAALLRAGRLQRVIICQALAVGGQHRTASFDRGGNAIYYEIRPPKDFTVAVIHHELFHFLDQAMRHPTRPWEALNLPDFHYGQGGAAMYNDPRCGLLSTGTPGFLTRYATSAVEEDRAETFSHLMVERGYVQEHAAHDPVLAAKVKLLGEELHAFCPDAGPNLWEEAGPEEPVRLEMP